MPDGSSSLPQVAARRTDTYRWREGAVTISPIKNAAPARQKTASMSRRVISYPLNETIFLRHREPNAIAPRPM